MLKQNKNIDSTLYHTLNLSRSKQTHKFSRADRFGKTYQSPCKKSSYNLNSSFDNISLRKNSNFGDEKRFAKMDMQIKRHSLSPSPNTYQLKSNFNVQKNTQIKKATFGKQKKFIIAHSSTPGPGKYQYSSYNPQVKLQYTMRNKTAKNNTHWNLVGPGQYNLNSSFSTINSTNQGPAIKIGKQKRFNTRGNQNPPPNAYHYNTDRMMTQPTSKFNKTSKYSFGDEKRFGNFEKIVPGPGAYHQFSQFYQSSYIPRR